jgi:hypothetical protein
MIKSKKEFKNKLELKSPRKSIPIKSKPILPDPIKTNNPFYKKKTLNRDKKSKVKFPMLKYFKTQITPMLKYPQGKKKGLLYMSNIYQIKSHKKTPIISQRQPYNPPPFQVPSHHLNHNQVPTQHFSNHLIQPTYQVPINKLCQNQSQDQSINKQCKNNSKFIQIKIMPITLNYLPSIVNSLSEVNSFLDGNYNFIKIKYIIPPNLLYMTLDVLQDSNINLHKISNINI